MENPTQSSGQSSGQKPNQNQPQLNLHQNQKPQGVSSQPTTKPETKNGGKNTNVTPTTSSPAMQIVAAFVVGILVGVIGYTLVSKTPSTTALNTSDVGSATSTVSFSDAANSNSIASATDNSIIVHNQPAGTNVTIAQIDLKNNGWVAIQEDTNGKPGVILGAAYFVSGQTLNGVVSLLRPTIAGTSYLAVLHTDDGTKPHVFNYHTDTVLSDSTGNPIATPFTAQ